MKSRLGKMSKDQKTCPHCNSYDEYSEKDIKISYDKAVNYKICIKCHGEFADIYLIHFIDSDEGDPQDDTAWWETQARWEDEDHAELFQELLKKEALVYNGNLDYKDSDFYEMIPKSIHYVKKIINPT